MASITFPPAHKAALINKLKTYFDTQLDYDIGQFECEFLLDFMAKEFGVFYYNQGIEDAQTLMLKNVEDLQDALYALGKPLPF